MFRLGGWIDTTRFLDGIIHEHGPRTVRPAGPQGANTLELVETLGLQSKLKPILRTHPAAINRFILVDGQLRKLPSSLGSLFKRLEPFERPLFMSAFKDLMTPARIAPDDSIYDFVSRRFGTDLAKYAIDPMVRGICAGDARTISAASFVTANLYQLEQNHGGVLKGVLSNQWKKLFGSTNQKQEPIDSQSPLVKRARDEKWSVWSLENGLSTLVSALEYRLLKDGVEIVKKSEVKEIETFSKGAAVTTSETEYSGNHVFLSTPAFKSSKLLSNLPEASEILASIPYVTVPVVTIEYDEKVTEMDAFGFLVPSDQKSRILGAIFDTCSFPQGEKNIFTVMMGGAWFKEFFGDNPTEIEIEKIAVEELSKILNIKIDPSRVVTKIQRNCIAQYTVGHKQRVAAARNAVKNSALSLIGSSYDGVGINDSIMSAKNAVLRDI